MADEPAFEAGQRARYTGSPWHKECLDTGDVVLVETPFAATTQSGTIVIVLVGGPDAVRQVGVCEHDLVPADPEKGLTGGEVEMLSRRLHKCHALQSQLSRTRGVSEEELQWHRGARTAYKNMMDDLAESRRNNG